MDTALSDIRADAPITLNFRGKTLQAVLHVPDVRAIRSSLSLVPHRHASVQPLRTVDLADEALRINPVLSQAMDRAQRLLSAGLPIVVTGESGSGKTAFAKAVARHSVGAEGEIVVIDCAVLEPQADFAALLQRRLNGQRSCLLIDRIDEMDEERQTALLGLLESDRQAGVNGIGVIVISTLDLDHLVRENRLRPDLLHRLKGGAMTLAPLRNAPDLPAAIGDLFRMERESLGKPQLEMDDEARLVLMHYHWPGNLRELRNALRHAVALADGKLIRLDHLPGDIVHEIARKDLTARSQSEASKIEAALRYNGGNVSLTARYLGVSRATLYRKIQITKARGEA